MIIIKNKYSEIQNEYIVTENIAILKLSKKDGNVVDAKVDYEDLKKILAKGTWFLEWHKDFNNYLVLNISDNDESRNFSEKQTLQSFILGVSTKAPIRHINGDTLDNRKSNLEVYNQNRKNDYIVVDSNSISIILRDKYGRENAKALIDHDDLDRVINNDYSWVLFKIKGEPYAVENTPNGRVFLNRFIMDTPEDMDAHHINLNPLDNRKHNLENKLLISITEIETETETASETEIYLETIDATKTTDVTSEEIVSNKDI